MTQLSDEVVERVARLLQEIWKVEPEDARGVAARILEATGAAELVGALEFYAKPYNWQPISARPCGHLDGSNALADQGDKARAAIAAYEAKGDIPTLR